MQHVTHDMKLQGDSHSPIQSYHIISYHIISYHIISYHIISYHIRLYDALSLSCVCVCVLLCVYRTHEWSSKMIAIRVYVLHAHTSAFMCYMHTWSSFRSMCASKTPWNSKSISIRTISSRVRHCNNTATHCNTLQHTPPCDFHTHHILHTFRTHLSSASMCYIHTWYWLRIMCVSKGLSIIYVLHPPRSSSIICGCDTPHVVTCT